MRFEVAGSEFQSGIQEGCASKKLYTIEPSFRFGCCGWRVRETSGGVLLGAASHFARGGRNCRTASLNSKRSIEPCPSAPSRGKVRRYLTPSEAGSSRRGDLALAWD